VFERFTDRARRVLVLAQEESRLLGHSFIGTEHLLLGLISNGKGSAFEALHRHGLTLDSARQEVEDLVGSNDSTPTGSPPFTPRAKKALELALRESLQLGHKEIRTGHLLLGLLREGEGVGVQVLSDLGVDPVELRRTVLELGCDEGVRVGDAPIQVQPLRRSFRMDYVWTWPGEDETLHFLLRVADQKMDIRLARTENPDLYAFIVDNCPPLDDSTAPPFVTPPE
jgi:ATP-dependent Clp protease ATP-binding subunit ClpA